MIVVAKPNAICRCRYRLATVTAQSQRLQKDCGGRDRTVVMSSLPVRCW
eukprot:COSAG02_NODE_7419_length_3024_cov_1.529231_1_plen_48_part_10